MRVYLTCKKCGKRRSFVWNISHLPDPERALAEGWSSDGNDLYCKDCAGWIEEVTDEKVLALCGRKCGISCQSGRGKNNECIM